MNHKLITTLIICNLFFASIVLSEWFYLSGIEDTQIANHSSVSNTNQETIQLHLNQQPEENYVDLVNRPLFIQGRKPVIEQNLPHHEPSNNEFNWSLSGIFHTKQSWRALLVKQNTAPASSETTAKLIEYRKVVLNDEVDGWVVSQIEANTLRLTRGSNEKELLLRKKEKQTEQHQPAALPFYSGRDRRMKPIDSE